MFAHRHQGNQQNMAERLGLTGLILDRLSGFGGKPDHLLFDFPSVGQA